MNRFHDSGQDKLREPEKSFVPAPNAYLRALCEVGKDFIASVQKRNPHEMATLDMDATLLETHESPGALQLQALQGLSTTEHPLGEAGSCLAHGIP